MTKGIIGAGNWLVDNIKTINRWPEVGTLCNVTAQELSGGGGPCNVLFDIAKMDDSIPLYAVGKIGDDKDGDFLLAEMRKRNIDVANIIRTSEAPTSYTDVMSGDGKRTFFHNRGANALLGYEDIANIDVDAKIFYLGYLLLLDRLDADDEEFGTVGAKLLSKMQKKGYITVVDFVSEAPEKFKKVVKAALPYINVLVINEVEAGNTFNMPIREDDGSINYETMKKCCESFIDSGVNDLVVIHYPEGAYTCDKAKETFFMPSFDMKREDIVGSNGAGDAFCAGILYGLHENYELRDSLMLASASSYANLKSKSASNGALTLEELKSSYNHAMC